MKYIALLLLLVIATAIYGCTNAPLNNENLTNTTANSNNQTNTNLSTNNNTTTLNETTNSNVLVFKLTGENFRFFMNGVESPTINVKEGDRVRIEFTSIGGFHDFVIDEFNAATDQIGAGQTSSVEFVANKKGTFEYYCSVGSHRAMGMKGTFIVT
jgi:heme/copper-type cytochrome/quinol oxidase subunit 2